MVSLDQIQPGDLLLYKGNGFFSKIIQIKTWSPVSHCEVYAGNGKSWASRDGIGVGTYDLRTKNLYAVLRPKHPVDLDAMAAFEERCRGQKYDWFGLLRFFTFGKQSLDKQFCSEFTTRQYRAGGLEPFAPDYDADLVSPGMFLASPAFIRL